MLNKKLLLTMTMVSMLSACATPPSLYYWGQYEDLLYQSYLRSANINVTDHIVKLKADIDQAVVENKQIAPGIHVHLGYLYYQQGQIDLAEAAFNKEQQLYPESQQLIESLLAGVER